MLTTIPKHVLIEAIFHLADDVAIRQRFRMQPATDLRTRLRSIEKSDLVRFLVELPKGNELRDDLEAQYPLGAAQSFFVPKVSPVDTSVLFAAVSGLAEQGLDAALAFPDGRRITRVFVKDQPSESKWTPEFCEIKVLYELRIDFVEANETRFGEQGQVYGLEQGLIWLFPQNTHAVIVCSSLNAVKATIRFGIEKLGIEWWLPTLTEEMFNRLTSGDQPRAASYTSGSVGVPSISIYHRDLENTELFRSLETDSDRRLQSGFFMSNTSSLLSFGVSRRNARIWTPYKHEYRRLVVSAREVITRIEGELENEFQSSESGFVRYHRGVTVTIGIRDIRDGTHEYETFLTLLDAIVRAYKDPSREVVVSPSLLSDLVASQAKLKLIVAGHFECSNCGGGLGRCPQDDCLLPYSIALDNGSIQFQCPKGHTRIADDGDLYTCECGTENPIASLWNHIQIYPEAELLGAISRVFLTMREVEWNHSFLIDGNSLILLPKATKITQQASLEDLTRWRVRARIQHRMVTSLSNSKRYLKILNATKEKCFRNGRPPTRLQCNQCLQSAISIKQLETARELCLPRILGYAIGEGFDGIHHGHEIADVKYTDHMAGIEVSIGIHLKSRTSSKRKHGLGRSTAVIKALYTQAFYSAYLALRGNVSFDVIGISIPNQISQDATEALSRLLNTLGFASLMITEADWLKIIDAVYESLSLPDQNAGPGIAIPED